MTIDFNLSSDQRQIVESIQDVLTDKFPLSRFRDARGDNHDTRALAEVAALGWLGLGVAEQHGGAGLTLVEDVLLFRALGKHLVTPNVMAGSLGAHLALAVGNAELASEIVTGGVKVSLASRLGPETDSATVHALYDSVGADYCLHWDAAQIACVPIGQLESPQPARCLDKTIALLRVPGLPAGNLSLTGDAAQTLRRRADLLVAAQLLGLAEGALDLAVDYAKLRHQFGQPIGSFQAIKHRCADMKVRVKVLSALVLMAALSEHERRGDAALQIAAARLLASRYALENAAAGIQIHGAMGFTAECDAHRFLVRAHLLENLGSTSSEREVEMASLPLERPDSARSAPR
jgi:alkylation response protein AidB-like acyl-CoA dehydrogenase